MSGELNNTDDDTISLASSFIASYDNCNDNLNGLTDILNNGGKSILKINLLHIIINYILLMN